MKLYGAGQENITVFGVCSAAGVVMDPLIIYKAKNMQNLGMVTKPCQIPIMGNQKTVGLSKFCVISLICFYLSKQFCTITINFTKQLSREIQNGSCLGYTWCELCSIKIKNKETKTMSVTSFWCI